MTVVFIIFVVASFLSFCLAGLRVTSSKADFFPLGFAFLVAAYLTTLA